MDIESLKIWNIYWEQVKYFMINYETVEEKNKYKNT